jgi:hypothetical protein
MFSRLKVCQCVPQPVQYTNFVTSTNNTAISSKMKYAMTIRSGRCNQKCVVKYN